jgi:uncharacterized LabA/DUF88 family protein
MANDIKNVIVLIDYENIALEAVSLGMVVDFEKLAQLRRSFGNVIISVLFVPKRYLDDPWFDDAWKQGFHVEPVPMQPFDHEKQYRTADAMMNDYGVRMCGVAGIDAIVIVSHDGDFIPLANLARDLGKQVILVAGEHASRALVKAVDIQFPLPMKV